MLIPLNNVGDNTHVEDFEKAICEYTQAKYAIAVNSATSGLFMCLYMLQSGGDVLMPAYGYPAVYKICDILGLNPVPVELDYNTMSIDLEDARQKLTSRTIALVNIESEGVLGNLVQMKSFCYDNGLTFIEDAAPCLPQKYSGVPAGRYGDVGVYSFSATKILDARGGGIIVTDDKEMYEFLSDFRYSPDFSRPFPLSLNFTMSPYLARELLKQYYEMFDYRVKERERVHNLYKKPGLNIFEDPAVTNHYPYALYRSPSANVIHEAMNKFKIGHRYKHYAVLQRLPNAVKIQSEVIDFPILYDMGDDQIKTICTLVRRAERGMF